MFTVIDKPNTTVLPITVSELYGTQKYGFSQWDQFTVGCGLSLDLLTSY